MAFRPLPPTTVRWRPMEGDGLEHLTIAPIDAAAGAAIRACGTIIGSTDSLPIRRIELTPEAGTAKLSMLYISFDGFAPMRDSQRYTCITPEKLYRYAAEDRAFTVDLPADADGLVIDYTIYFKRLDA